MTEAEFRALAAQGYNRIPLVLETFADLDTPLSLYVKLAHAPFTFLLESVVGGERFGRYSFIGLPARTRIRARGTAIEVEDAGTVVERHEGDPLAFVQAFLRRYRAAPIPGLPRFCGGLAGMFGYDTVRHIERRLADTAPPDAADLAASPGHPAPAHRGARRRRQPRRQDLAHRLRRSGGARRVRGGDRAARDAATQAARAGGDPVPDGSSD